MWAPRFDALKIHLLPGKKASAFRFLDLSQKKADRVITVSPYLNDMLSETQA